MMRYSLLPVLLVLGCAQPDPAGAQAVLQVAPFRSVALSDGGRIFIRQGAAQSVTLVDGEAEVTVDGTQLRIGHCRRCPRRQHPRIEIVVPALDALSVAHGGQLVVTDGFRLQSQLAASVSNGGVIDARTLAADSVTASVEQGGIILVRPMRALNAAVSQGGRIAYWGAPQVTRAIRGGGVVEAGRTEDSDRPLAEFEPRLAPPPHRPAAPAPKAR